MTLSQLPPPGPAMDLTGDDDIQAELNALKAELAKERATRAAENQARLCSVVDFISESLPSTLISNLYFMISLSSYARRHETPHQTL